MPNFSIKCFLSFVALAGVSAAASAQDANCYAAPPGSGRQNCLYQQQEIYRQQQDYYNNQARETHNWHQGTGAFMSAYGIQNQGTPWGDAARAAGFGWNAPRIYYDYRYGTPE